MFGHWSWRFNDAVCLVLLFFESSHGLILSRVSLRSQLQWALHGNSETRLHNLKRTATVAQSLRKHWDAVGVKQAWKELSLYKWTTCVVCCSLSWKCRAAEQEVADLNWFAAKSFAPGLQRLETFQTDPDVGSRISAQCLSSPQRRL